jgi:hypothetical protein
MRLPAKKAPALMQLENVKIVSSFLFSKKGLVIFQDDSQTTQRTLLQFNVV